MTTFVFGDPNAASGPKKSSWQPPAAEKCTLCDKNVYATEKLCVDKTVFHKNCFRCNQCNRPLGVGNYASANGKMFCKPHFQQLFKLKGNYSDGFGEATPSGNPSELAQEKPIAISIVFGGGSGSGSGSGTSSTTDSPETKLSKEPTPRMQTVPEPLQTDFAAVSSTTTSTTPFPSSYNASSADATPFPSTYNVPDPSSGFDSYAGESAGYTGTMPNVEESYYYSQVAAGSGGDYYAGAPSAGTYDWVPSASYDGYANTQPANTGYAENTAPVTSTQPWETPHDGAYNYGALPPLSFQPEPTPQPQIHSQPQTQQAPVGPAATAAPVFNPVFEEYVPTRPQNLEEHFSHGNTKPKADAFASLKVSEDPVPKPSAAQHTVRFQLPPTESTTNHAASDDSSAIDCHDVPLQPPPPNWQPTPLPSVQAGANLNQTPVVQQQATTTLPEIPQARSLNDATIIPVPSAPVQLTATKKKKSIWKKLLPCT